MKKRFLALLLSAAMAVSCVACGKTNEYRASDMSEYIKLGQYTGFEVEVDLEVTDEEIQKDIQYMLEASADYEQLKEGTVANGDKINIDYEGVLDGATEPFEGGSDTDSILEIGSHKFIDTFEEQLIGHKPGEVVNVVATFPEDYGVEDLNGKKANFTVTINYICGEKKVPEWTDEFVSESTNGEYTTTADYEKFLREGYEEKKKEQAESNKQMDVMQKIVDKAEIIKYSQEDVDAEYNQCIEYYTSIAESYYGCSLGELTQNMMGVDEETFKKQVADEAYLYVVGDLALLAIAYKEGLSVTQKEYDEKMKALVKENGLETTEELKEKMKESYGEEADTYLWDEILKEKAMDFVLKTVVEI